MANAKPKGKLYRASELHIGDHVILPSGSRLVMQVRTVRTATRIDYPGGYIDTVPNALVRAVRARASTIDHDMPAASEVLYTSESSPRKRRAS